jgi:putative ABC transport system substrate-binding protein
MIETGIVASLAHPGGNFTGLNKMTPEYTAKRLDLLKDMLPEATYKAIAEKVPAFQKAKA